MGNNTSFKTLSVTELLEMTSHPNYSKIVQREHSRVMAVPLRGTVASFPRQENYEKNRHSGIPCWDYSRVIINSRESVTFHKSDWESSRIVITSEETLSTYIHANFVDGYEVINKFVCTQTPMKNTWKDFWKMIWEQKSRVIVSLTDTDQEDQENYEYWTNAEGYEVTCGRYIIRTLEIKEEISFTRTRLRITNVSTETSREFTHFWFTDWPDNSIPTGLEEFLSLLTEMNREQSYYAMIRACCPQDKKKAAKNGSRTPGPIVVQSSAGVGWAGTFCAIDNALTQLRKEKRVSLPQTVLKIRSQRHSSVLLPEQYAFCYKVLEHVLLAEAKKQTAELIPHNKRFAMYVPNSRRKELKIV